MDVQTDNADPPPSSENQPSGKIRKGFKLFGKRKPGNIFSIRSKGDGGNNKSPINQGKAANTSGESDAPDGEQEAERGEMEQADEEALCEDAVRALAEGRPSISSASSAKSLSFLSLLRGGRRGTSSRRVNTVSQPVARQRRGLKGLFANVKLKSKDKEDREEAPPSPLLMSSRANSVEIIKEDLTLTPKSQPRSLDQSPTTESRDALSNSPAPSSAATTPSDSASPKTTAGSVSTTKEHAPPLPTSAPPLPPGDNSLSCLLADISSLLTFDSIAGGDIMADVEAEWGRATSPVGATSPFKKPLASSPPRTPWSSSSSSSSAALTKPPLGPVTTTAPLKSFTPLTTSASSAISKPSCAITASPKSVTLSQSDKWSSVSSPASGTCSSVAAAAPALKEGTPPTLAGLSSTTKPPSLPTTYSTAASTATAPTHSLVSSPPTSTASVLASGVAAPLQTVSAVFKTVPVATSPLKIPAVSHSPPTSVAVTQSPSANLDSRSSFSPQTFASYKPFTSFAVGESKASVSQPGTICATPPTPAPVILSKATTAPSSSLTSVSASVPKPLSTSTLPDFSKTPTPASVTLQNLCQSSAVTAVKTEPLPASAQASLALASMAKMPAKDIDTGCLLEGDKMMSTPMTTPATTTNVVPSTTALSATSALAQTSQANPVLTQPPVSAVKDFPVSAQILTKVSPLPVQISSKSPPAPIQIQSKEPPVSFQIVTKDPSAASQIVTKDPPVPVQIQSRDPPPAKVITKDPSIPPEIQSKDLVSAQSVNQDPPVSVQVRAEDPTIPAQIQSKDLPVSAQGVNQDPPVSVEVQTKDRPIPVQIQSKALPPTNILNKDPPVSVQRLPADPPALVQVQTKDPPLPSQSVPKDPPVPVQTSFKDTPVLGQILSKDAPSPGKNLAKDPPVPALISFQDQTAPIQNLSKDPPVSAPIFSKDPTISAVIPISVSTDLPTPVLSTVSVCKESPTPGQTAVPQSKAPLATTPAPALVSSTPVTCPSEALSSTKMRGSGQTTVDAKLPLYPKPEEPNDSPICSQVPTKEKRTPPQTKTTGLSRIPVVGGGRTSKLPVRESTHDDLRKDPPTPEREEETSGFNSYHAGSKENIADGGPSMPTTRRSQEEIQLPHQPKVVASVARDSRIPVKHSAQSHLACQFPQAKEPPRTKIPVSKVPVRRVTKPAAAGCSYQMRK